MEKEMTETDTLAADLRAIDAPAAVAERQRRAEAILDSYGLHELLKLEKQFSMTDRAFIIQAWRTEHPTIPAGNWRANAAAEANGRAREVGAKYIAEQLRLSDIQAVHADPDRLEAARVQEAYVRQVGAMAFRQGNREDFFIKRFAELVTERAEALAVGDNDGARAAERRLNKHTGIDYPQMPAAAWETADLLPAADRDAEHARLAQKYGPRADAKKSRGRVRVGAAVEG
jgi:hypothetical protein